MSNGRQMMLCHLKDVVDYCVTGFHVGLAYYKSPSSIGIVVYLGRVPIFYAPTILSRMIYGALDPDG